jgi:hypothetical protein
MTFKERAKIAEEILSRQLPVTLEEARAQAVWLKRISTAEVRKELVDTGDKPDKNSKEP